MRSIRHLILTPQSHSTRAVWRGIDQLGCITPTKAAKRSVSGVVPLQHMRGRTNVGEGGRHARHALIEVHPLTFLPRTLSYARI